jgi:hypothetical protein
MQVNTVHRKLKELKKGDIIVENVYCDDMYTGTSFHKIIRINKKTITAQQCNRSGALDSQLTSLGIKPPLKYFPISDYNPRYMNEQQWEIVA